MHSAFSDERRRLYDAVPYFYPNLEGEEYALLDIFVQSNEYWQRIRHAAEEVGSIFHKTATLVRTLNDDTLKQLGYPEETFSFLKQQIIPQNSIISRLDFVVNGDSIKLLELNADTPTFIKETYEANEYVCRHFQVENPNAKFEQLLQLEMKKAIEASWYKFVKKGTPKIVFTSHGDHDEDKWTTRYLQKLLGLPSEYVQLDHLRLVTDEGLYTPSGEKIDILYRQTYPIEHLVTDLDPTTGEFVGQALLKLVEQGDLTIINPPSSFLLQSKAVQALIWGLHEENQFFSQEEHAIIAKFFLPTYLDETPFKQRRQSYVKKPCFGREGDTVEIFDGDGELISEEKRKTYSSELPVYQQFVQLPSRIIQTLDGPKEAHYMVGCFLINKHAGAIGIRAGNAITNNESYFLPIGSKQEEK